MMIKLQPAPETDNIVDGHELTKLPYPFFVTDEGKIDQQDLWQGDPYRAIGFQKDLAVHMIDLWWTDAIKDVGQVVGMYLVTSNSSGKWGVHRTAISSAEVLPPR